MRWSSAGVAGWHGDYPLAERRARDLAAAEPNSRYWQAQFTELIGSVAGAQGKLAEAEEKFRASASLHEARGALDLYLTKMAKLAQFDLRYHNRPSDALAIVSEALAKHPLASIDPGDRPYPQLAITYALAGQPDEAQRLMSEYAHTVPLGVQKGDPDRLIAAGEISAARGRFAEAVSAFQASREENMCATCGAFELAQAYTKLGHADSALAHYEQYLATGGTFRVMADASYLAASYQRLGELYEAKGDRKQAVDNYEKLVALWKNADPELQPIVKDAHARIARLSGEH